jgi:hypothetical protein
LDADKKNKRRNSARKNRRKKGKISPCKDNVPTNAWGESPDKVTNWNNQSSIPKVCNEAVGKNVNDLTKDYKNNNEDFEGENFDATVYNVIDKLEKVGLKDDTYLAGDFDTEELEKDFFSSDEFEDSFDDT